MPELSDHQQQIYRQILKVDELPEDLLLLHEEMRQCAVASGWGMQESAYMTVAFQYRLRNLLPPHGIEQVDSGEVAPASPESPAIDLLDEAGSDVHSGPGPGSEVVFNRNGESISGVVEKLQTIGPSTGKYKVRVEGRRYPLYVDSGELVNA